MFRNVARIGYRQAGYRPDVEGLRAVAVLLVVAFHAKLPGFQGGFIGVDVFFVISGYLISALLLKELSATGSIDFRAFYARRARRLLPAAFVMAAATVCVGAFVLTPLEQVMAGRAAAVQSVYASNFWFLRQGMDYFSPASTTNPLLHTWSLAVEEQFYLVWPALLLAGWLYLGSRRAFIMAVAACCALSLLACLWIASMWQPWAFYLLPTRAWEFGAGALTYLGSSKALEHSLPARRSLQWLGLLLILAAALLFNEEQGFPGWRLLIPIAGTCAVLLSGAFDGDGRPFWPLAATPMQLVGHLSYSFYLWHWPTLVLGASLVPDIETPGRLALVAVSLALAGASYALVENPVRRHPWLGLRPGATIALGGALTVLGVFLGEGQRRLAQDWANSPSQLAITQAAQRSSVLYGNDDCETDHADTVPKTCAFGDVQASRTVVLLGDSHAAQWFTAVEHFAGQRGLKLVTFIKRGCAIADVPVFNIKLNRWNPECQEWREAALRQIVALRPLLVVVTSNEMRYVSGPGRHLASMTTSPQDWGAGVEHALRVMADGGLRVALIRDTPFMSVHVPTCLSRTAMHHGSTEVCGRPRQLATDEVTFASELSSLRNVPGTSVLDMTDLFCDREVCPAVREGIVVYRDSNHVSEDYVRRLQEELAARLDRASGGTTSLTPQPGARR